VWRLPWSPGGVCSPFRPPVTLSLISSAGRDGLGQEPGFCTHPPLHPHTMSATPTTTPLESQQTEIETLRAIYGEAPDGSFIPEPLPLQPKAWGKSTGLAGGEYGIRVKGLHQDVGEDSGRAVEVVLVVKVSSLVFLRPSSQDRHSPASLAPTM
jgi:hypothetical protein